MYLLTHASIVASLGNFYDVTRAVGERGDKYFMSSEEGKNIMYSVQLPEHQIPGPSGQTRTDTKILRY